MKGTESDIVYYEEEAKMMMGSKSINRLICDVADKNIKQLQQEQSDNKY